MDNNLTNIKERILLFANNQGIAYEKFFESIGMTYGNFKGQNKKRPINSDTIEIILTKYPEIDPVWLLTGSGTMLKDTGKYEIDKKLHQPKIAEPITHDGNTIPLYDLPATAGVTEVFAENPQSIPMEYITIPNLPKCDGALHIRGDSMYPLLKSGDIVAYKVIHDIYNVIWGEMYLISVSHNGDEYFFCKFLKKSSKEGYAEFISHNQHHQPIEFPFTSIKALALVKVSIRFNTLY